MKEQEGRENVNLKSNYNYWKHAFTPTTSEHRMGSQENEHKFTDGEKRWGRMKGEEVVEVCKLTLVTSMKKMRWMRRWTWKAVWQSKHLSVPLAQSIHNWMPRNENKLQKTRSVGDGRAESSCMEKNDARMSCEGLDINILDYKYKVVMCRPGLAWKPWLWPGFVKPRPGPRPS